MLDKLLALSATGYVSPLGIAFIYRLGEKDQGFEWMEKAYQERSNGIAYMAAVDPSLKPVRDDPRLRDLMRRAGLPE